MVSTSSPETYDVIVIGAGIAGLTAAKELKKLSSAVGKPLKILILEAKDRVGGRTLTIPMRTATATDQLDMGGQWVGVTQHHILDLLNELHLNIFPQYVDGMKVAQFGSANGIRRYADYNPTNTWKSLMQFSPLEMISFAIFLNEVESMVAKVNPLSPFDIPEAIEWDSTTLYHYVINRYFGRCQLVLDVVELVSRTVFGFSSCQLSLLYFLLYSKNCDTIRTLCEATGNGSQAFRVVGGTQQISRLLAENVGWDRIRLEQPVWKINYGSDGVEVWTMGKQEMAVMKGSRLIMAIPPQQVGRISFEPPLPEDQRQLFASCPSGNLFKFNVTYATPFWRKNGYSGEIAATGMTDDPNVIRPLSVAYDATTAHGNAAIVGFLNTEWCGTDPKVRRDAVLADLARYLGDEAFDYIDYVDKNWSEEPYAGGCPVGAFGTGGGSNFATGIRRVTGPIHFAGTESARKWMGYMSGAVESGLRASQEVLAVLMPNALTKIELKAVASSTSPEVKVSTRRRYYKRRRWRTWRTAALGLLLGAVATIVIVKRIGFESPIKIKLIYSL